MFRDFLREFRDGLRPTRFDYILGQMAAVAGFLIGFHKGQGEIGFGAAFASGLGWAVGGFLLGLFARIIVEQLVGTLLVTLIRGLFSLLARPFTD